MCIYSDVGIASLVWLIAKPAREIDSSKKYCTNVSMLGTPRVVAEPQNVDILDARQLWTALETLEKQVL